MEIRKVRQVGKNFLHYLVAQAYRIGTDFLLIMGDGLYDILALQEKI